VRGPRSCDVRRGDIKQNRKAENQSSYSGSSKSIRVSALQETRGSNSEGPSREEKKIIRVCRMSPSFVGQGKAWAKRGNLEDREVRVRDLPTEIPKFPAPHVGHRKVQQALTSRT